MKANPSIKPIDWLDEVQTKLKRGNKVLFAKDCALFSELNNSIAHENRKVVVLWAFELATDAAKILNERYPDEVRPQNALDTSRAWAKGLVKMRQAQRAILDCHAFAKELSSPEDSALCHAIGQACASVHTSGHAIGFPVYELTALVHRLGANACRKAVEYRVVQYKERIAYWHEHFGDYQSAWADFIEAKKKRLKAAGRTPTSQ